MGGTVHPKDQTGEWGTLARDYARRNNSNDRKSSSFRIRPMAKEGLRKAKILKKKRKNGKILSTE